MKVHLPQTPVWNAFWVTCCLALMSVILNSKTEHLWTSLADLWAVNVFPLQPLCSCCFCFDCAECRLWFSRRGCDKSSNPHVTSGWLASRPVFSERSGERDLAGEVRQPLGAMGSSLERLLGRWCLEFSLSLWKNRERGEKTLYGINWLLHVSILTCPPP